MLGSRRAVFFGCLLVLLVSAHAACESDPSSHGATTTGAGGGSGGVGVQPSGVAKGAGGAGGAYEIKSNVILTPGATVDYFIGAGALATAMAAI